MSLARIAAQSVVKISANVRRVVRTQGIARSTAVDGFFAFTFKDQTSAILLEIVGLTPAFTVFNIIAGGYADAGIVRIFLRGAAMVARTFFIILTTAADKTTGEVSIKNALQTIPIALTKILTASVTGVQAFLGLIWAVANLISITVIIFSTFVVRISLGTDACVVVG